MAHEIIKSSPALRSELAGVGVLQLTKAFKLGEFQDSFELANKALEAW